MDDPTNPPEAGQDTDDTNGVDDAAKASYDKAKGAGKLFSTNEKNRANQESEEGAATWSKWPKQNGGGGAAA